MIKLSAQSGLICVSAENGAFASRHENQLAYWGFQLGDDEGTFLSTAEDVAALAAKVVSYLRKHKIAYEADEPFLSLLEQRASAESVLRQALMDGQQLKDGLLDNDSAQDFCSFLDTTIVRKLKPHQIKAALHLLHIQNGANFSVPGSGKTTVVLSVFERLRQQGVVDSLFVVGPPSSFGPWQTEYCDVLGFPARCAVLAGGDADARKTKYLVSRENVCDLYLTSFQTFQRDWEHVRILFQHQGIRFYFVIDEAHYIKQIGGAWAQASLGVAGHASRRCVLTGTPFPRTYSDVFNLFDVLWPLAEPVPQTLRHQIDLHSKRGEPEKASELLSTAIDPLFYRVRKEDLKLAPQVLHEPIVVPMKSNERRIYDAILGHIRNLAELDSHVTVDLLFRLRRGRMIRLRQCTSYAVMLDIAIDDYDEDVSASEVSLSELIRTYDKLETPGKLDALLVLVKDLYSKGQKIVIWSNFVRSLRLIRDQLARQGYSVDLIYGDTPTHEENAGDELTRDAIIREFCKRDTGLDILVANPAACAESISLHKACSNAIYYDLSYNCAQYIQSMDRIHRVGGSEHIAAHYNFLQYENTLDQDILVTGRVKLYHCGAG